MEGADSLDLVAGLRAIVARGNGRTIEANEVLGLPSGAYFTDPQLQNKAEAAIKPYREAGLVVRHCIPFRMPEVWYSLSRAGLEALG